MRPLQVSVDFPLPTSEEETCATLPRHKPSQKRRHLEKYWLFSAAGAGCLACVRRLLEVDKVDPESVSDSQSYNVFDFAMWADEERQPAMLEYLRQQCPQTERMQPPSENVARRRGLETAIASGPGYEMLARMGWLPGEALGSIGRDGLLEPLAPVQRRRARAGLGSGESTSASNKIAKCSR